MKDVCCGGVPHKDLPGLAHCDKQGPHKEMSHPDVRQQDVLGVGILAVHSLHPVCETVRPQHAL